MSCRVSVGGKDGGRSGGGIGNTPNTHTHVQNLTLVKNRNNILEFEWKKQVKTFLQLNLCCWLLGANEVGLNLKCFRIHLFIKYIFF